MTLTVAEELRELHEIQTRLEGIKEELDWELRRVHSGMPGKTNAIFLLRVEASPLEAHERLLLAHLEFNLHFT